MIPTLQKLATGRRVLFLFIITMLVYLFILMYSIPAVTAQAPDMKLFDMSPGGYDPAYAGKLLESIGAAGRDLYLNLQLPVDFIYPGLFALTYTLMLIWLFGKRIERESKIFLFAFIPAITGLLDYLENIGIILMLKSFPHLNPTLVHISSLLSVFKSIFTIAFYILLCYGLLLPVIKRNRI